MSDPNLVYSGAGQEVVVEGVSFRVEIFRLEHENEWTLEVVDENGTSTVWDDIFRSDTEALDVAVTTIRSDPKVLEHSAMEMSFHFATENDPIRRRYCQPLLYT